MAIGTVKFFDPSRGFGIVTPSDDGADLYVSVDAVERAGWSTLSVGERLHYDRMTADNGRPFADNLSRLH